MKIDQEKYNHIGLLLFIASMNLFTLTKDKKLQLKLHFLRTKYGSANTYSNSTLLLKWCPHTETVAFSKTQSKPCFNDINRLVGHTITCLR